MGMVHIFFSSDIDFRIVLPPIWSVLHQLVVVNRFYSFWYVVLARGPVVCEEFLEPVPTQGVRVSRSL
jgi:hypothetical protein